MSAPRRGPVSRAVLATIDFYQRAVSPALPPRCRFYPTCSAYAATAIRRHGVARGSWLSLVRLLKCAPWHPGGVDHVPPARGDRAPDPASTSVPSTIPTDGGPVRVSAGAGVS